MIDTHCHLTFKQFETDKDEVIESAKKVLSKVIVSGTEPEDSVRSLALHEEHPDFISIALGLHPKFAVEIKGKELEEYFEFIKENEEPIHIETFKNGLGCRVNLFVRVNPGI